jgi:hypothetical protein
VTEFEKFRKKFEAIGNHMHQTNGLHVHISKSGFRDNKHLERFIDFFYDNIKFMMYVSERPYCSYLRWCNMTEKEELKESLKCADKHVMINLKNSTTVEVRIFRSSADKKRIMKNLEFLLSVIEYTKKETDLEGYLKMIEKSKKYPNLKYFLRRVLCA